MEPQASILSGNLKNGISLQVCPDKKTMLQMKVKHTQLQKDLKALAKAEEVDLRSQQAKELQFRTRYGKYLTRGNFETSLVQKDGFKRVAKQTCLLKPNFTEHIPLHKLIYTNGEVDVEKVVCLHLLSVQDADIMSFPDRRNLKLFQKRSKANMLEASALPFYILEIIHQVDTELKVNLKVGQDVIILVNSNLEKLVISILEVLEIVSPQKLLEIRALSLNKKAIQEMMIKTKISNLIAQIKEYPVLLKIENYRLEIAQFQLEPSLDPNVLSIGRIKVKDRSRKLELIQTEVKKRINNYIHEDFTSGDSWQMFHKKLCNCKKASSRHSVASRNAIALLNDDGREFAMVTGAGCCIPSGSSVFCPSLTAIIKSSPRQKHYNISEDYSNFSVYARGPPIFKSEQNKLISTLLHKVNNAHRLLIGKKAAEFKPQTGSNISKQKVPINKILENVFSRQSLISFASTAENEELKLLFQPCCKGGLGIGSFILESEQIKTNTNPFKSRIESMWKCDSEVYPQMMKQEDSIMNTAFIKQDIFTSETRNKMKLFLLSDNPGDENFTFNKTK